METSERPQLDWASAGAQVVYKEGGTRFVVHKFFNVIILCLWCLLVITDIRCKVVTKSYPIIKNLLFWSPSSGKKKRKTSFLSCFGLWTLFVPLSFFHSPSISLLFEQSYHCNYTLLEWFTASAPITIEPHTCYLLELTFRASIASVHTWRQLKNF